MSTHGRNVAARAADGDACLAKPHSASDSLKIVAEIVADGKAAVLRLQLPLAHMVEHKYNSTICGIDHASEHQER